MDSFYTKEELGELGFKLFGNNVLLSRKASYYGVSRIEIGNNVRIDDFCVLSAGTGGIKIGNYVHIGVGSTLIGEGQIILQDFCGLSSRVAIYSSNDNYSGEHMTNPTIPEEFTGVIKGKVIIGRHVIIGSGSIVLPGVTINEGAAIAALSLVNEDCDSFYFYKGNPAKKIVPRSKKLLMLEQKLRDLSDFH